MTQNNLLEQAHQGNPQAIAYLINRSIQKQGITATVDLEEGCLDVMLDAPQAPSEVLAEFIRKGLLKLDIEPVYQATVYGRKAGEHFAIWSQQFEFKPRPATTPVTQQKTVAAAISPSNQENRSWTLTISADDGETRTLDLAQLLGFVGAGVLLLGIFCPIISAPLIGSVTYFKGGSEEGIALVGLAIASIFCLAKGKYSWVYGTGLWSFLLVALPFVGYQARIADVKSQVSEDLIGNPFRGLADAAIASVQLQWGWILLFLGSGLVLTAAYLKKRHLDKQAFISMGVVPLVVFALAVGQVLTLSIQSYGQADKAKQSEARVYIGSINRGQQAYYLDNEKFASQVEELGLGIESDSRYYRYEIKTVEQDMTVATATPKDGGLKSYTGAVFLTKDASGEDTTIAIACESNRDSKAPPSAPTLNASKAQCSSGSTNLDADSK